MRSIWMPIQGFNINNWLLNKQFLLHASSWPRTAHIFKLRQGQNVAFSTCIYLPNHRPSQTLVICYIVLFTFFLLEGEDFPSSTGDGASTFGIAKTLDFFLDFAPTDSALIFLLSPLLMFLFPNDESLDIRRY